MSERGHSIVIADRLDQRKRLVATSADPYHCCAVSSVNPLRNGVIDRASIRTIGRDLQRPECMLPPVAGLPVVH
jgi:hypothetical protein